MSRSLPRNYASRAARGLKALLLPALLFAGVGAPLLIPDKEIAAAAASVTAIRTQDEAFAYAKSLAFVPDDAELQDAVLSRASEASAGEWDLTLHRPDKDSNGNWAGYYNVRFSAADGSLRNMSLEDRQPESGAVPTTTTGTGDSISRGDAVNIAASLVGGLNWGLNADWRLDPYPESEYDTRFEDKSLFRIRFYRAMNGIRTDNWLLVIVRPDGRIASYTANWNAYDFSDPTPAISAEKAKRIYLKQSSPLLAYKLGSGNKPFLAYTLWQTSLKASTGVFPAERNGRPFPIVLKPLSTKQLAPLVTNAKLTDAQMRAKVINLLSLTGTYKISKPQQYLYKLVIPSADKKRVRTVVIGFDQATGQVYLYQSDDGTDHSLLTKAKVSESKARLKAVAFLKKAMPAFADQLAESRVDLFLSDGRVATRPLYRFEYVRVAGGVGVSQENVYVDVNAYNGEVESIQSQLMPVRYPSQANPKVSAPKAVEKLLSLYDIVLRYRWVEGNRAELFYELMLKPSVPR
ncbi:YcdB/YcdC domain-containing protein [Cohnella candidum]|uniref:YcdB/YcdC repeated domain-containing protein n=1 Tax=Cohnella candidum TaxID=2674991 RepID=A0A3G3JZ85_9BACL|nr:YcdB/YcdC domain-containing protein [Cohnella candidum]AYQ73560.1 hypothetical protein EAV92_13815 [Cohnella candidum]